MTPAKICLACLLSLLLIMSAVVASAATHAQHPQARPVHHPVRLAHRSVTHPRRGGGANLLSVPLRGKAALQAEIQAAIAEVTGLHTPVGIEIRSMQRGDILFSVHADQVFVPASTLKILTAEAALIFLGPEYHFSTRALTNAKGINDGILAGDVWLVHSGDPSLTWYDMKDLMVSLRAQQVRRIQGDLHIDNTAYDQENTGPGWLWKDRQFCYAAPISASIINHNCEIFSIVPARREKQPALIVESPRYFYSPMHNGIVTRSRHARGCHVTVTTVTGGTIELNGCLPRGQYARTASVVVPDIVRHNEAMVKRLLRGAGIRLSGQVLTSPSPAAVNLHPLAVHVSKPLRELISDMLKKSDNVMAGSIFKKLGQLHSGQPGSWKNGSQAVHEILQQKAGVNTQGLAVLDGSGLSPENQVTPEQMMRVLDFAFHHESSSYEFISSLPVSGLDGTLKNRLQHIRGRIRAKTGTMADAGVSSLAGYAMSRDHEPLAFVMIVNGHRGNIWKYRAMEDRIALALARFSRGG